MVIEPPISSVAPPERRLHAVKSSSKALPQQDMHRLPYASVGLPALLCKVLCSQITDLKAGRLRPAVPRYETQIPLGYLHAL